MFLQQPAQHRQQANTVYVAAPKAGDTVTVRVASGTVQVDDTLHAVVRQTGGEVYAFAALFLTLVLVGVTIWAQRQVHRLQTTNNDLQAEHAKLQREFNHMEAQHEAERRAADTMRHEEHERAVDARISAEAYVVRRTVRGWIIPVQHGRALGVPPTVEWVGIVGRQDSGAVEERLQRMVADAPLASPLVGKAAREAYVLYYKAKGPGPKPPESLADLQHQPLNVRQAQEDAVFTNLLECVERLTAAIDPELRDN